MLPSAQKGHNEKMHSRAAQPASHTPKGSSHTRRGAVGIDFGTTNSSVALAGPDGQIQLASFSFRGEAIPSFRSVLYLEQVKTAGGKKRAHGYTGPQAIEHYLDAEEKGRLIQSLKSHLSSRTLTGTEIFGRRHRVE